MNTSVYDIHRIVKSHPSELRYLFKSPTEDKRRLTKIISKLVPYRVGLEFECFGCLTEHLVSFNKKLKTKKELHLYDKSYVRRELVRKKLGVYAFSEDFTSWSKSVEESGKLNEIRISILGYKQLIYLFNSLELMNQYCLIPAEKGGIHIHIDCPEFKDANIKSYALDWYNRPEILSEVLNIFGGYKGTYNSKGVSTEKRKYIRLSPLNTVEFRIGHLTYDYRTIINWIIKCSDLVRRCRTDYHNKVKPSTDKKALTNVEATPIIHNNVRLHYNNVDDYLINRSNQYTTFVHDGNRYIISTDASTSDGDGEPTNGYEYVNRYDRFYV